MCYFLPSSSLFKCISQTTYNQKYKITFVSNFWYLINYDLLLTPSSFYKKKKISILFAYKFPLKFLYFETFEWTSLTKIKCDIWICLSRKWIFFPFLLCRVVGTATIPLRNLLKGGEQTQQLDVTLKDSNKRELPVCT